MIYLDHNATTEIHPDVLKTINEYMALPLNPSSIHSYGRKAKSIIEKSRVSLAKLLGFDYIDRQYQIVFTASGTEANNLVLNNFQPQEIFISAIEHSSVYDFHKKYNSITVIKTHENGLLDLDDLKHKLSVSQADKKLISVMLANNETGIIQPIKQIVKIAHEFGAYVHSDSVQAIGKMPVNMQDLGIDFMSISAHKFGGMIGAGALIYRASIPMQAMIIGGGQEKGMRSGTENIIAISALGVAAEVVSQDLAQRIEYLAHLRDKFELSLQQMDQDITIVGQNVGRLPNTTLFIDNKHKAQLQIINFDRKNICLSSGSACSSGKIGKSHVLLAMGYSEQPIESAIRVSFGMSNSEQDIKFFFDTYNELNG